MRSPIELAPVVRGITVFVLFSVGCGPARDGVDPSVPTSPSPEPQAPESSVGAPDAARFAEPRYEVGLASWYGNAFRGKRTSNGERFDPGAFTAAHKKLPFGTWVDVTRRDTGRTVRVRINDRGPNGRAAHRIIDLSQRAAAELDIVRVGVVEVELRIVAR